MGSIERKLRRRRAKQEVREVILDVKRLEEIRASVLQVMQPEVLTRDHAWAVLVLGTDGPARVIARVNVCPDDAVDLVVGALENDPTGCEDDDHDHDGDDDDDVDEDG
jgi:hypothetical protein